MPPIPSFNSPQLLGALEIGAFVSIFLLGTVVVQGHIYYKNCKDDSKWLVSLITLILLLELGHAVATVRSVWWATITIADMVVKPGNGYDIVMCTAYSAIITFLVKAYYIQRLRQLSYKANTIPWLAILGWLLTTIDFGACLAITYEAYLDVPREPDNFQLEREWGWLITTNFSLSASVDVFIAAAMVYHLRRFMITNASTASFSSMKGSVELMNGLLIWTVETGLLTSIVSVAALVCFQLMRTNYIWFTVYLPLAKLYSNSLLASLNARSARRVRLGIVQQIRTDPSTSASSLRFARPPALSSLRSSIDSNSSVESIPYSSWSSGTSSSSSRRSTIASTRRPPPQIPGISSLRRSTVATQSPATGKGKIRQRRYSTRVLATTTNTADVDSTISNTENSANLNFSRPRVDSVSSLSAVNEASEASNSESEISKKRMREHYVYSNSVFGTRPRASSRLHSPSSTIVSSI